MHHGFNINTKGVGIDFSMEAEMVAELLTSILPKKYSLRGATAT